MNLVRERWVVFRESDNKIFCGSARNYEWRDINDIGNARIVTYMSEKKAISAAFSSYGYTTDQVRAEKVQRKCRKCMFHSKDVSRKKQLTYWLQYEAKDCGLMQPPMKDTLALDFLKDYLLGEDWYIVNPVNHEQCNAQLVHEILYKYSRVYRKEYNKAIKRGKNK